MMGTRGIAPGLIAYVILALIASAVFLHNYSPQPPSQPPATGQAVQDVKPADPELPDSMPSADEKAASPAQPVQDTPEASPASEPVATFTPTEGSEVIIAAQDSKEGESLFGAMFFAAIAYVGFVNWYTRKHGVSEAEAKKRLNTAYYTHGEEGWNSLSVVEKAAYLEMTEEEYKKYREFVLSYAKVDRDVINILSYAKVDRDVINIHALLERYYNPIADVPTPEKIQATYNISGEYAEAMSEAALLLGLNMQTLREKVKQVDVVYDSGTYGKYGGFFEDRRLYVITKYLDGKNSSQRRSHLVETFLHELGHAIDVRLGDEQLRKILKENRLPEEGIFRFHTPANQAFDLPGVRREIGATALQTLEETQGLELGYLNFDVGYNNGQTMMPLVLNYSNISPGIPYGVQTPNAETNRLAVKLKKAVKFVQDKMIK